MNLFRYSKSSIATFILLASFIIAFTALISCSSSEKESSQKAAGKNNSLQQGAKVSKQGGREKSSHARPKLLELGSKNCIPCRMMEPILANFESICNFSLVRSWNPYNNRFNRGDNCSYG